MKVVILAGGSGSRLWPFSRLSCPKQFLNMGEGTSLLQQTVERLLPYFKPEDLILITPAPYELLVKEQLPHLRERVIVEPEAKNTAPAILLGVKFWESYGIDPGEPILVLPSDHRIREVDKFLETISLANALACGGEIVLFGVAPTHPETAYGYLKIDKSSTSPALRVEKFIEKPSKFLAEELISSGKCLWNAGIFVFTAATFWKKIRLHAKELASFEPLSFEEMKRKFPEMPSLSIDYALMEKLENCAALTLHCGWSDMGSWDTVFAALEKDSNQNVKVGNVVDIDTKNSLIFGGKRMIATVGLEGLLVIETEDAIFLGKKGESQKMKAVIEELMRQGQHDIL